MWRTSDGRCRSSGRDGWLVRARLPVISPAWPRTTRPHFGHPEQLRLDHGISSLVGDPKGQPSASGPYLVVVGRGRGRLTSAGSSPHTVPIDTHRDLEALLRTEVLRVCCSDVDLHQPTVQGRRLMP